MKRYFIFLLVFTVYFGYAQDEESEVVDNFEDYADLSREQVYLHFNKSSYIVGEMLGFNAYVFLKEGKQLSSNTTNLYCQIIDGNDKVIKEKLLLVTNGVSRGDFMIDSLFTSGEYKLKAYTNWMRNFNKEHNYFLENFRVIDPVTNTQDKPIAATDAIDIQFLPESGHLLSGTENVVGIIAKDKLGVGVSNLRLKLFDATNTEIAEATLNQYGIGNFLISPKNRKSYTVKYNYNEKPQELKLPVLDDNGVILSIKELPRRNSVAISLKTNQSTLKRIKEKGYKLSIHNGGEIKEIQFTFRDSKEVSQTIATNQLFPGINVFTLFNEVNRPIAERMYFNFEGLNLTTLEYNVVNNKSKDSLEIKIAMPRVSQDQFQNISVSVLPSATKSYQHHQNIISALYLQPYIRSAVEHANYYFTDITDKKKVELDNLLLTLGWSSYDWATIFNESPEGNFDFEVGLSYTINRNDTKEKNLIIYPNINSNSEILTLVQGQQSFEKRGFFPLDDETLRIGAATKKGKIGAANLVLQYSPIDIKLFSTNYTPKTVLTTDQSVNTVIEALKASEGETLEEVKLFAKRKYTRIEKLQNQSIGKITEFDDELYKQYRTIGQFLSSRGFLVEETPQVVNGVFSIFRIYNRSKRSLSPNPESPRVYLDGVLLNEVDILSDLSMQTVDYVNINKGGIGEGFRGGFGTIRIVTDPRRRLLIAKQQVSYSEYKVPLTFTTPKRFYIPRYQSFESLFFEEYGIIDWFPNVRVGDDGSLTLKVLNTKTPITLFIEGVVNTDQLVSDFITIQGN